MKILLTTLNAKFIHSSLALRNLKACAGEYSENIAILEFTINQTENFILAEIFKRKPDIIGFSCYIWNIRQILGIISSVKKILPDAKIILGGPEISYEYEAILEDYPIDKIIVGEGEQAFYDLLRRFKRFRGFPNEKIVEGEILDLDLIPFAYKNGFSDLENRIIYYETSRGCPYNCDYCLSGSDKGIRYLSFERVKSDLSCFLDAKVKQVKFVDRTFNANKRHAMAVWEFLIDRDNEFTNFHFEVCADLLSSDEIELLKKARKGLFQLEIGVQSTSEKTLESIGRKTNLNKIYENVRLIKKLGTIHQHLDLIAGLPYEDYASFKKSFNDVFATEPEMLQLGFLKVLKGSKVRENADIYGIIYKDSADYEVLSTNWLTYEEILKLKSIEHVLEIFYNSGQFIRTLKYLISFSDNPFEFFEKLASYWSKMEYHSTSHSKINLYVKLYHFANSFLSADEIEIVKELLLFDLLSTERLKSLPDGLPFSKEEPKNFIHKFYSNSENIEKYFGAEALSISVKQLIRQSNLFWFDYIKKNGGYILFNYTGEEISTISVGGNSIEEI